MAADPLTGDVSIAAQIAAQTLGPEFKQWLNDPQKLLQLIAAAEGANSGGGGGTGCGRSSHGSAGQRAEPGAKGAGGGTWGRLQRQRERERLRRGPAALFLCRKQK